MFNQEESISTTDGLVEILRAEYNRLEQDRVVGISIRDLADYAIRKMDKRKLSTPSMRWAATLEMRQLARSICRGHRKEDEEITEAQESLFEYKLQPRYPAERNDDEVYVLREELTLEERRLNAARLRKEGKAKLLHATALDAETEWLIANGRLKEHATV